MYLYQFAVHPNYKNKGIGKNVLEYIEQRATYLDVERILLDTSVQARDLIGWYKRQGYKYNGYVSYDNTDYYSVVLGKELSSNNGILFEAKRLSMYIYYKIKCIVFSKIKICKRWIR